MAEDVTRPAPARGRIWRRIGDWGRRHAMGVYTAQLSVIGLLILVTPRSVIEIPAGHAGVLWLRFLGGTVTDRTYGEGVHLIFPWDEMIHYDARLQNAARVYDTISSNGLTMQVDIAVRYRVNRDAAGILHKLVGPRYDEVLVYPEIGSYARELISRYTPEQLYTETRAFIQAQILERMAAQRVSVLLDQEVHQRLVEVEDVLIRSVMLPVRVQDAIERKVEQYQAMLEYDFRITREAKEAERKRIEARGLRDFQEEVSGSITDEYLRLRGIEATMALSTSRNTKIIIVGGKEGLPVILSPAGAASGAQAPGAKSGPDASPDSPGPPAAPEGAVPDSGTPPGP